MEVFKEVYAGEGGDGAEVPFDCDLIVPEEGKLERGLFVGVRLCC